MLITSLYKKLFVAALTVGTIASTSCGPHSGQQQDSYKSTDVTTAPEQTKDQADTTQAGAATDQKISEGQTGEKSGSGGLPGQSVTDRQFITSEVIGNYDEIKLANLGIQHSTNSGLRSVAAMLVKDHTDAIAQLKKLSLEKGITLPTAMPSAVNAQVKKMSSMQGNSFNTAWCQMLVDAHKKTISTYEGMSNNATDEQLKAWITGILPKLRTHLDMLTSAQKKLGA